MIDLTQFISDPSKLSMLGMMGIAIWAIMSGRVITIGHHNAIVELLKTTLAKAEQDRDEFKEIALSAADTTKRAIDVAAATAKEVLPVQPSRVQKR